MQFLHSRVHLNGKDAQMQRIFFVGSPHLLSSFLLSTRQSRAATWQNGIGSEAQSAAALRGPAAPSAITIPYSHWRAGAGGWMEL